MKGNNEKKQLELEFHLEFKDEKFGQKTERYRFTETILMTHSDHNGSDMDLIWCGLLGVEMSHTCNNLLWDIVKEKISHVC